MLIFLTTEAVVLPESCWISNSDRVVCGTSEHVCMHVHQQLHACASAAACVHACASAATCHYSCCVRRAQTPLFYWFVVPEALGKCFCKDTLCTHSSVHGSLRGRTSLQPFLVSHAAYGCSHGLLWFLCSRCD